MHGKDCTTDWDAVRRYGVLGAVPFAKQRTSVGRRHQHPDRKGPCRDQNYSRCREEDHAPLSPRTLLPDGFLQAKLFRLFRIFGAAALASAGTAGAAFTPIPDVYKRQAFGRPTALWTTIP